MLATLFRLCLWLDRNLATPDQRSDARTRARHASALHGAQAVDFLLVKLRDRRRSKSKRVLRLAIGELVFKPS